MEYRHTRQIQVQEVKQEPATERQIRFLETMARNVGMRVNTNNITKEKAGRIIDQLKSLDKSMNGGSTIRGLEQKKRDYEIRLGMAKKLVFQKWTTECRRIHKQTENAFIKEVIYINEVLNKIDKEVLSKQAA